MRRHNLVDLDQPQIITMTRLVMTHTRATVFQAVTQAYLDVVRDQALLAVNRNNEYVLGQAFESTPIRAEIGELTGTDLAQAQSSLEQATAQRVAAEGQLEISRANYTRAVGRLPGRLTLPRERPVLSATREALTLAVRATPTVNLGRVLGHRRPQPRDLRRGR